MPTYEKYRVKVLEKAFRIMALFDDKGKTLSVKDISEQLVYNKSSTLRIVRNLEEFAYLQRVSGTQMYKLGFGIYNLGQLAESYADLRKAAQPFLERLCEECGETIHLAVMQNNQALYVDKTESKTRALRIISAVGTSLPCHCSAVGKVLLSALSERQLEKVIEEWGLAQFTHKTITEKEALVGELESIHRLGYAVDDEEIEYGLKCVAAPIMDGQQKVVAAVSVSGPKERVEHNFDQILSQVIKNAAGISVALGQVNRY